MEEPVQQVGKANPAWWSLVWSLSIPSFGSPELYTKHSLVWEVIHAKIQFLAKGVWFWKEWCVLGEEGMVWERMVCFGRGAGIGECKGRRREIWEECNKK